jgi:hypothetical protein
VIGLTICTLKIGLFCNPYSLAQTITNHYCSYLEDISPDYMVNIRWDGLRTKDGTGPNNIDKADMEFTQGGFIISSPVCLGTIDILNHKAELSFRSNQPVHDIEYFLRIVLSFGLYGIGGFLLHAAGIVHNNKAFIFFGKSGCGKSTIAKLSAGYRILSDDLIGLLPSDNGVVAYSTPFWNPGWVSQQPYSADIHGLYRLVQDNRVFLTPVRSSIAVSEILASIPVITTKRDICVGLIPIIQKINERVGVYYLHFKQDNTFWGVVEQAGLQN